MTEESLNRPKQFRKWLKKAGIRETGKSSWRREGCSNYFKGHGRYWRINCYKHLDMSEPFDQFDRWANSREASVPMTARNESEFVALVKMMLEGESR